jgi:hypothetical protein
MAQFWGAVYHDSLVRHLVVLSRTEPAEKNMNHRSRNLVIYIYCAKTWHDLMSLKVLLREPTLYIGLDVWN